MYLPSTWVLRIETIRFTAPSISDFSASPPLLAMASSTVCFRSPTTSASSSICVFWRSSRWRTDLAPAAKSAARESAARAASNAPRSDGASENSLMRLPVATSRWASNRLRCERVSSLSMAWLCIIVATRSMTVRSLLSAPC